MCNIYRTEEGINIVRESSVSIYDRRGEEDFKSYDLANEKIKKYSTYLISSWWVIGQIALGGDQQKSHNDPSPNAIHWIAFEAGWRESRRLYVAAGWQNNLELHDTYVAHSFGVINTNRSYESCYHALAAGWQAFCSGGCCLVRKSSCAS